MVGYWLVFWTAGVALGVVTMLDRMTPDGKYLIGHECLKFVSIDISNRPQQQCVEEGAVHYEPVGPALKELVLRSGWVTGLLVVVFGTGEMLQARRQEKSHRRDQPPPRRR
jgi:hypothetical protein